MIDKEKLIKVLDLISSDTKEDMAQLDGKPFTGRTVAEQFGKQGAAINALAEIIKTILSE